jgi:hypothetical protein
MKIVRFGEILVILTTGTTNAATHGHRQAQEVKASDKFDLSCTHFPVRGLTFKLEINPMYEQPSRTLQACQATAD